MSDHPAPTILAYVTDIEGRWDKLESFLDGNPHVALGDGLLRIADGVTFVFGGDAIDRGPHARRIVDLLLATRRAYGERVVLLAGNRDINKLRLLRELDGEPPKAMPPEVTSGPRADLLRWIFANTMGAKDAFDHRRTELAAEGRNDDDESVTQSFLDDVAAGGALRRYLEECRIAFRSGPTLFLHGGITDSNAGLVPGRKARAADVDAWVDGLNDFYASQLRGHAAGASLSALLAYQAPEEHSRYNQKSVVYARPADGEGNPLLPSSDVVRWLGSGGVGRVVVGHTPSGDCPAFVRDPNEDFEIVLADNSYGRVERGSRLWLTDDEAFVVGTTELDDGTRFEVRFVSRRSNRSSPLGKRDVATGQLLKARLETGDYLLFRALEGFRVEQTRASEHDLDRRTLGLARART